MKYNIKDRKHFLYPFKIKFVSIDNTTGNDAYIQNIHKTDKISGSKMMQIVIAILKKLKVKRAYLRDGTRVNCNNKKLDLSFFKLIEKGRTFYQKFGFKFTVEHCPFSENLYESEEQVQQLVHKKLDEFKSITKDELIKQSSNLIKLYTEIINDRGYDKAKIYLYHSEEPFLAPIDKNRDNIFENIRSYDTLIMILSKFKHKYFYQILIELFNSKECSDYDFMMAYVIESRFYKVEYKSKKVIMKYLNLFDKLMAMRNLMVYVEL